jgi:hypothetical protein
MGFSTGITQDREFHRHLFTGVPAVLLQKIKSITRMEVWNTTAEIEPTTNSVVQIFTTNTVGKEFSLAPGGLAATQTQRHGSQGACDVLDLARNYGVFVLSNALALSAALGIEDGEKGF